MMFPSIAQAASALEPAWSWPHFRIPELACRCGGKFCGGEYWHMPDFLDALEALREKMERPLLINSGHRCAQCLGFTGIGLAKTFIHLDRRSVPATWYYKGSYSIWQT